MDDPRETPWYRKLPAKLAAVVVFLVALTTLAGNVLELMDKRSAPAPAAAQGAAPPEPAPRVAQQTPAEREPAIVKLRVDVDRIAVQHDGSPGTTDWRFTVEADGEPLLAFQQDDLDDTGGRNVSVPEEASATLRVETGKPVRLSIQGWRGSRLRLPGTEPDATGEGVLSSHGRVAPVQVRATEADAGSFTFYLSADPA